MSPVQEAPPSHHNEPETDMNAPALNPAATTAPGQAGPIAGAPPSGQAGGPLAGFEALLTALFPQSATPVVGVPQTGKTAKVGDGDAEAALPDAVESEVAQLPGDTNLAVLGNGLAGATVITVPFLAAVETTSADAAPAWGRSQTKATPASLNANASAGLTEPSELSAETSPEPMEVVRTGELHPFQKPGPHAPPAFSPTTQPMAQAPASPAKTVTPDTPPSDLATQPVVTSEVSQTEVAPVAAPAPGAAGLAARSESTPAPPSRNARNERAKSASDVKGSSDLRPTEAVDRAVHAKVAGSAATLAGAAIEADAPNVDEREVAAESPDSAQTSETRATAQTLTPAALTAHAVRGSPETVANLAAQILKKLEGQSTRFDLELNPGGLGKVDVRLEIGANGQLTAAMTFENPQAAAELRARASELQKALEQAGFNLSGGLTFDVAGDRGQQQRQAWQDQTENNGQTFRGQAFRAALDTAGDAADAAVQGALRLRRGVTASLDLRI